MDALEFFHRRRPKRSGPRDVTYPPVLYRLNCSGQNYNNRHAKMPLNKSTQKGNNISYTKQMAITRQKPNPTTRERKNKKKQRNATNKNNTKENCERMSEVHVCLVFSLHHQQFLNPFA